MANTTSKRIAGVQRYIQDNPADAFHLGIIYGMPDAIKKDAEEQEQAYMPEEALKKGANKNGK